MTSVNGDSKSSLSHGKSIPIRCLIEATPCADEVPFSPAASQSHHPHAPPSSSRPALEREVYAIVPSSSLFRDVIQTVLLKLGYTDEDVSNAKGAIQIKNWRALDLEYVTDNALASVDDMLGDLTTVATLRIKISSGRRDEDVKDKLLLMLLAQSYDCLQKRGCPIVKDEVEKVVTGQKAFSSSAQSAFYTWYNRQHTPNSVTSKTPSSLPSMSPRTLTSINSLTTESLAPSDPAGPKATRLRISFDSDEVSRLQRWFEADPHPTRQQMTSYLTELNLLPVRASHKPLDLTNIMYWFKNARAAARRSGRSITSDDLSEDEDRQSDKEGSTMSAPPLPNSNAVYMIRDPIVKAEPGGGSGCSESEESRRGEGQLELPHPPPSDDESDMEEDLSVTDDDDDVIDEDEDPRDEMMKISPPGGPDYPAGELRPKLEGEQPGPPITTAIQSRAGKPNTTSTTGGTTVTSSSSPNVPTAGSFMNMASRLPGYAFPYGALPMAYLQSQMNPFYKDWSEKVQSAVAHAQANTAQQNVNLVKTSSRSNECELSKAERQKRHRAFIDPVSEIPKLEQWFTKDTHPSHYVIEQICDDLNRGEFRSRYPKLSPKNIQLWFKNHRAKVKRMRVGGGKLNLSFGAPGQLSPTSGLPLPLME